MESHQTSVSSILCRQPPAKEKRATERLGIIVGLILISFMLAGMSAKGLIQTFWSWCIDFKELRIRPQLHHGYQQSSVSIRESTVRPREGNKSRWVREGIFAWLMCVRLLNCTRNSLNYQDPVSASEFFLHLTNSSGFLGWNAVVAPFAHFDICKFWFQKIESSRRNIFREII